MAADLTERAKRASSGGGHSKDASLSPPATPLRSPFSSTRGSSGAFGSSSCLLPAAETAAEVGEHNQLPSPPSTAAPAQLAPTSPQGEADASPPKTAPPGSVSRPQSLLGSLEQRAEPSSGNKRPSVAQIMTLTHPDGAGEPQPQSRVELAQPSVRAAPVVCGAPARAALGPHSGSPGPIRRRNRPAQTTATNAAIGRSRSVELQPQTAKSRALSPPQILASCESSSSSSSSSSKTVHVRQGPTTQSTVSPAPRIVRGDAPLERNAYDVILTGPNAGAKATHCRDYTESGIGLDYIPPKYGTSEWEDMASLQGKTRRVRSTATCHSCNVMPRCIFCRSLRVRLSRQRLTGSPPFGVRVPLRMTHDNDMHRRQSLRDGSGR